MEYPKPLSFDLGYKLDPKEFVYPVTRWDAFKDKWFPTWAKRRWPAKYITLAELIEQGAQGIGEAAVLKAWSKRGTAR
jgi:hypothetical protein